LGLGTIGVSAAFLAVVFACSTSSVGAVGAGGAMRGAFGSGAGCAGGALSARAAALGPNEPTTIRRQIAARIDMDVPQT
jgi:hypothetical protein